MNGVLSARAILKEKGAHSKWRNHIYLGLAHDFTPILRFLGSGSLLARFFLLKRKGQHGVWPFVRVSNFGQQNLGTDFSKVGLLWLCDLLGGFKSRTLGLSLGFASSLLLDDAK